MIIMSNRVVKTTHKAIIDYWSKRIDECGFAIDWAEAGELCWRCGSNSKLERCHIVPHSLGGPDTPENLVLLCSFCHYEAPNVKDQDFFWDWLKAHMQPFYNTFWGIKSLKEYEFVYSVSFGEECKHYNVQPNDFQNFLNENMKMISFHWGQARLNVATRAGLIKLFMQSKGKVFEKPKQFPAD